MKLINFLLLLCSLNLYSQDINYLKSQDTIYIVLKKINTPLGVTMNDKFENFEFKSYIDKVFNNYYFNFIEKPHQTIIITTNINDRIEMKRKKFLKTKSNSILDIHFIDSIGIKSFFVDLLNVRHKSKVVYIIDGKSLTKRKLVLRKAFIADIGFAEM